MNQRIILYERVQEEYDEFLRELLQLDDVAMADGLHELIPYDLEDTVATSHFLVLTVRDETQFD